MTDKEPPDEIAASSTEPLRWPDPSRPIVNERPPGYGGGYGQGGYPRGVPQPRQQQAPGSFDAPRPRPRRWPAIAAILVILAAILVIVWLLWWR